mgnify:CR=1 FL=1
MKSVSDVVLRVEQTRGIKTISFKKRRRQNSKRKKGHRQELTLVRIDGIYKAGETPKAVAKTAKPKAEKADAPVKKAAAAKAPAKAAAPKAPAAAKTAAPKAAATLGAGRMTVFRRVTLPMVAPSLAAGAVSEIPISAADALVCRSPAGKTQDRKSVV